MPQQLLGLMHTATLFVVITVTSVHSIVPWKPFGWCVCTRQKMQKSSELGQSCTDILYTFTQQSLYLKFLLSGDPLFCRF